MDRAPPACRMTALRRGLVPITAAVSAGTMLFVDPRSNLYPAIVWIPVAALFLVTSASLLCPVEDMTAVETKFWRVVAFLGLFSSVAMFGFGITAAATGSMEALSQAGRVPTTTWIATVAATGVVANFFVLYAVVLRARSFFPEPHHPRLAALDAISLGAAMVAIQGLLVVPARTSLGWFGALVLIQIAGWSVAVSGAFVNVLQGHTRFETSSRWILMGALAHSIAFSILLHRVMNAVDGRPTGGSAIGAMILIAGAMAFGEAFDADRRAAADRRSGYLRGLLYPSLEHDAFGLTALSKARSGPLGAMASPLVSVAGPVALAIVLALALSGNLDRTAVHRAILYAGFAVSMTASIGKLALGGLTQTQAAARLSTMLQGEKALVDEILVAVDKDRSAVATRVHDGLVQPMTAAYLKLSHAQVMLERGDSVEGVRLLREGIAALSEHIAEARSLVTTVYPPSLERLGLTAALKELVAAYRRHGLALEVSWDWAGNVDRQIAISLYRIANEALQNALLHADPKRARLRLCSVEEGLELEVTDEGPGFHQRPEAEYIEEGKLGIATMRRVADMIGATLEIESTDRTVVTITIPIGKRDRVGP